MTDTTTPTAPTDAPEPTQLEGVLSGVASFIPPKARAVIYTASGAISLGAFAAGAALHGTPEIVVEAIGAAAALVASVTALSHITS